MNFFKNDGRYWPADTTCIYAYQDASWKTSNAWQWFHVISNHAAAVHQHVVAFILRCYGDKYKTKDGKYFKWVVIEALHHEETEY